jgi:RNA polymerase sigma factor (sigma-70 family)
MRETNIQETDQVAFPQTHWSKFVALRAGVSDEHQNVLNYLLRRYWKPVYCYLRRLGYGEEDAKDLVQEFFTACLRQDFFSAADPSRGRFRNFLLGSLKHFAANAQRAAHARKRQPPEGFVSLDALAGSGSGGFEVAAGEAPDAAFHRAWVADVTRRVLWRLEQECRETGKRTHYELFHRRLVLPALEGASVPSLQDLARKFGLSEKQASNCLLTARRAYQRLLRQEIQTYASTEQDATAESEDLLGFLASE